MRLDLFIRLQLRHAALVYLAVWTAVTIPLWFAAKSAAELAWLLIGLGLVGFTGLLVAIDQRRNGAPDLFTNLGVSRSRLAVLAAAPANLGEIVLSMTLGQPRD